MRPVQLDAVESGSDRVLRALNELLDHRGQLVGAQCPRDGVRLLAVVGTRHTVDGDGARSHDLTASGGRLVCDASGVHHLGDDEPALGVHGVGHLAPSGYLLGRHQPRLTGKSLTGMARVGALTDDQAECGSLAVVLGHQRSGNTVTAGPHQRERGHHQPVLQSQIA